MTRPRLPGRDPRQDGDASFVAEISEITADIEAMAGARGSSDGSGGMVTKLAAARISIGAGCAMVIADGKLLRPVQGLENSGHGTWFSTEASPTSARKRWIAGSLKTAGSVFIDDGAVSALRQGKSLLPAGVTAIDGNFERGDAVSVRDGGHRELARGLIAYSAEDARKLCGQKSGKIADLLGFKGREEMIHRDDLALLM